MTVTCLYCLFCVFCFNSKVQHYCMCNDMSQLEQ